MKCRMNFSVLLPWSIFDGLSHLDSKRIRAALSSHVTFAISFLFRMNEYEWEYNYVASLGGRPRGCQEAKKVVPKLKKAETRLLQDGTHSVFQFCHSFSTSFILFTLICLGFWRDSLLGRSWLITVIGMSNACVCGLFTSNVRNYFMYEWGNTMAK